MEASSPSRSSLARRVRSPLMTVPANQAMPPPTMTMGAAGPEKTTPANSGGRPPMAMTLVWERACSSSVITPWSFAACSLLMFLMASRSAGL
jgi:hypothetical protein